MKFEVSQSPYGPQDEIGRLNEITPASRKSVLSQVDGGKVFDLSTEYFMGMPSWDFVGDPPYQIWMTHTPAGTRVDNPMQASPDVNKYVSYSGDAISMYTHCGTHIDTLNHFGYNGQIWNHFKASERVCFFRNDASNPGFFQSPSQPCFVLRIILRRRVAGVPEPRASVRIWPGDCVETPGFRGSPSTHRNRH